jgi:hypothetical protein
MGTTFFIGPFRFQAVACKDGVLLIMNLWSRGDSIPIDEWCLKEPTDIKMFARAQAVIQLQQWIQECHNDD